MKKEITITLFVFLLIFSFVSIIHALTLNVIKPVNGDVYSSRNVEFNLTSDEDCDFYYFRNRLRSNRAFSLCKNTKACNKTVRARMGDNNITIKIINNKGETNSSNVDFKVDNRVPRIIKTSPRDNHLINNNTEFFVKYTEANLKNVTLFYNKSFISKTDCESGRRKECKFSIDLTKFDREDLKFWFELEDIAGNKKNSSVKIVKVDTTKPIVKSQNYNINRRRVRFVFEIDEENFDKILLRDNRARRPKWRRLCSRLIVGSCSILKTFRPGKHDIDVKVLDKAGNEATIYTNEQIVI